MLRQSVLHSLLAACFVAQSASDNRWSTILANSEKKSVANKNSNRRVKSKCNNLGSDALLRRMKDEGNFNPNYMALTLDEAAENFEDLAKKHLLTFPKRRTCDAKCNETLHKFVTLLEEKNKLPPADQVEMTPDLSNKIERISPVGLNQARFRMNQVGNTQWLAPWRAKRAVDGDEESSQAFTWAVDGSWEQVGSDNVAYCWKEGDKSDGQTGLHRMCATCRSVRRLPPNYFPHFVNEVLCRGSGCFRNEGACVQQYINLNVLKNIGTNQCQNWIPYAIRVSVCCDCMLKTSSFLFQRYFESPFDD